MVAGACAGFLGCEEESSGVLRRDGGFTCVEVGWRQEVRLMALSPKGDAKASSAAQAE